jgi:hypothetical protein
MFIIIIIIIIVTVLIMFIGARDTGTVCIIPTMSILFCSSSVFHRLLVVDFEAKNEVRSSPLLY